MNQDERRFDFHGLGLAIKQAREERGWTQAYLAELVGKTDRTIMSIENKGQHPSLQIFFELMLRYNISVDQFLLEQPAGKNTQRRQLDALLDDMSDTGIRIVTATAREIAEIEGVRE